MGVYTLQRVIIETLSYDYTFKTAIVFDDNSSTGLSRRAHHRYVMLLNLLLVINKDGFSFKAKQLFNRNNSLCTKFKEAGA